MCDSPDCPKRRKADHMSEDKKFLLGTAAISLVIVLAVLAYGIINTNRRAAANDIKIQAGVECILLNLEDHRFNSFEHFVDNSKLHGSKFNPKKEAPREVKPFINGVCDQFFKILKEENK